ncbi:hypothetical protein V8G54_010605 [Vigna mungo]|uniref:AB hydrolase-1 domain-containing protein n=1 Tax=Vigna mungo TaxID=3915 RepID=A0AAQ3NXV2_VIGMU
MLKREKCLLVIFVIFLPFLFVCVNGKHFVLVHGAFHGAWCWYKVADQLKSEGENVTSLDMAACGVNPKQSEEVDSVSEYHKPLITFLASLPPQEKVILVGHSLGGLSVSIAMEKYPHKISVAVFITAAVVTHNLTYLAFLQELLRFRFPLSYRWASSFTTFGIASSCLSVRPHFLLVLLFDFSSHASFGLTSPCLTVRQIEDWEMICRNNTSYWMETKLQSSHQLELNFLDQDCTNYQQAR